MTTSLESQENVIVKQTPCPVRLSLPSKPNSPLLVSTQAAKSRSSCQPNFDPDLSRHFDQLDHLTHEICADWIELTGFCARDWNLLEGQLDKLMFVVERKALTETNRHYIKLAGDLNEKKRLLQRHWLAIVNSCHRPICYVKISQPLDNEDTRMLISQIQSSSQSSLPKDKKDDDGKAPITNIDSLIALAKLLAYFLRHYVITAQTFANWKGYLVP